MLRILLFPLLVSCVAAWPWDSTPTATIEDCGPAQFKLIFHKITQNVSDSDVYHPNQLSEVSIMYANDDRVYEDIQIEFNYWVNGIPMPTQTEDACTHGIICPQIPGEYQVSREIQFPTMPGKTKAEIIWKSQGTVLLCIRAMVFVPILNALRWR